MRACHFEAIGARGAGVIVATPGWALPGSMVSQAHRGQALAWVILFRPSSLSGAGGLGC